MPPLYDSPKNQYLSYQQVLPLTLALSLRPDIPWELSETCAAVSDRKSMGSYLPSRQFCQGSKCVKPVAKGLKVPETSQCFKCVGFSYKLWISGLSWKMGRPGNDGVVSQMVTMGWSWVRAASLLRIYHFKSPVLTSLLGFLSLHLGLHGHWSFLTLPAFMAPAVQLLPHFPCLCVHFPLDLACYPVLPSPWLWF